MSDDRPDVRNSPQAPAGGGDWRGAIGGLDRRELDAFLATGTVARLATLDEEGWPYVVPVWFEWDPAEGVFWVVPRQKSAWARHMARDGRVALTIDSDGPPNRRVSAQGVAEVVEGPNVGGRWVEVARRMAARYLGPRGPDYLVPTLDKPRWLFKVTPRKLVTWQGGDWHPRYKTTDERDT